MLATVAMRARGSFTLLPLDLRKPVDTASFSRDDRAQMSLSSTSSPSCRRWSLLKYQSAAFQPGGRITQAMIGPAGTET